MAYAINTEKDPIYMDGPSDPLLSLIRILSGRSLTMSPKKCSPVNHG